MMWYICAAQCAMILLETCVLAASKAPRQCKCHQGPLSCSTTTCPQRSQKLDVQAIQSQVNAACMFVFRSIRKTAVNAKRRRPATLARWVAAFNSSPDSSKTCFFTTMGILRKHCKHCTSCSDWQLDNCGTRETETVTQSNPLSKNSIRLLKKWSTVFARLRMQISIAVRCAMTTLFNADLVLCRALGISAPLRLKP